MWSRRRGGDGDARPLDTPAGPAATPATPAADGGWAALPVIQRTVTPITPMVGVASFRDGLAAQTPPHPFIGSLGHEVSRQAPAGIVTGLAAPVQRSDGPNMPVRSPDAPVEAEPRWRSLWSRPRRTLPFGSRNVESVQRSSSPGSAGRAASGSVRAARPPARTAFARDGSGPAGAGDAPARMPVVSRSSTTAAGPTMTTAGATPPPTTTTAGATPAPRMSTAGRPPISKPAMTVAQRTITASPPSATPAGGPGAGGGPLGGTPEGRRPAGAPAAAPESRAAAEATPPAPSPLVAG